MPYFRSISFSVTSEELLKPKCILCQSQWLCRLLKYVFFHHLWTGIVGSNPTGLWIYACVFPVLCCFAQGEELWWAMMAPSKESYQTCINKIYTLAKWETLGCTGLWATPNGMVYILKLEYYYPINLKYVVYLPVLKMVDDDNHHWHKLFKCTSTVCNVMLVHCTRSTLLFIFMAEFC